MYKYNGLKYNFSFTFTKKDKVVTPMLAWGKLAKNAAGQEKVQKLSFIPFTSLKSLCKDY